MKMSPRLPSRSTLGKSILLLFMSFALAQSTAMAQVFQWARMGGGNGWKHANAIAVDASNNIFTAGEFTGTNAITFGSTTLSSQGTTDGLVVMYNPAGNLNWTLSIGGAGANVIVTGIAVGNGDLYITGEAGGTSIAFGSITKSNVTPGSSFVAKFSYSGSNPPTATWATIIGPTTQPQAPPYNTLISRGIAIDANGDAYIAGSMSGDGQFSPQVTYSVASSHLFVAKFASSNGDLLWEDDGGGSGGSAHGMAIAVSSTGVAVTGDYSGSVSFGTINFTTTNTLGNFVLARWDLSGSLLWAVEGAPSSTSVASAKGRGLAIDNGGYIHVVGTFTGSIDFEPYLTGSAATLSTSSITDFFYVKYHSSGSPVAAVGQGNVGLGEEAIANGVAISGSDAFITGTFSGTMSFGSGGTNQLQSIGNHDIFVARYDANGAIDWARRAGNVINNGLATNHYDQGTAIAIDGQGRACIAGEFGGDAAFFNINPLSHPHSRNIFTARISSTAKLISGMVKDANSTPLPGRLVQILDVASSISEYVVSDASGNYSADVPSGNYLVTLVQDQTHWTINPANGYSINLTGTQTSTGNDFTLTAGPNAAIDLRITMSIISTENAFYGQQIKYKLTYENIGNATMTSGLVSLNYDSKLNYVAPPITNPSLSAPTAGTNSLAWTLSNLNPFEKGSIVVTLTLKEDYPDSTHLYSHAQIVNTGTGGPGEPVANLKDNTGDIDQDLIEPLDPNGKTKLPGGNTSVTAIRSGEAIVYNVEFYNLGPGSTTRVEVFDDLTSAFAITQNSEVTVLSGGPGAVNVDVYAPNRIKFDLPNAVLVPYSQSVSGSRGFVTFSIHPQTSASSNPIGGEIRNKACVTFIGKTEPLDEICTNPVSTCITPDFTFGNVCHLTPVQFTTTVGSIDYLADGNTSSNLRWNFGDGTFTYDDRDPSHLYDAPGVYEVTLTYLPSPSITPYWICDRYDTVFVIKKLVHVFPPPQPVITSDANGLLTSTPGTSYKWYRNGVEISGATSQSYQPTQNGVYTVEVTNGGGCSGQSNQLTIGVREKPESLRAISIAPNPGNGLFSIDLGGEVVRRCDLAIVDARGSSVLQRSIQRGTRIASVDLSNQPSGVYSLRIEIDGEVVIRELVVTK